MLAVSFPAERELPMAAQWVRVGAPGSSTSAAIRRGSPSGEASKTSVLYWTRRKSAKEVGCPEKTSLEKRWVLLICAIPPFSVKIKEQIFTLIPLNVPRYTGLYRDTGGKETKSHCIYLHPFSGVKVADLIFLSGLVISCTNPLRVQWWDSKKKLLLSGSGYCWCFGSYAQKTLVTCPLVFFRLKLRDNKMSTYCA